MLNNYAKGIGANEAQIQWIDKHCIDKPQSEAEHIIDYLVDKNPKLDCMTYAQAKSNCDKWLRTQMKKGSHIKESPKDIEVVLDFGDGFKFVKLVGENAYKREGLLMSHCVASYYGKNDEIYSLRDANNMPHCTISKNSQQIKGKGNGSIDPLYIKYVVEFLEFLKIPVRDSEMLNLGYINVESLKLKEPDIIFSPIFREKYFYKQNIDKVANKDRMSLWEVFGLFSFSSKLAVKFNFDIAASIKNLKNSLSENIKIAARNYNEIAAEDSNKIAAEDSNKIAARNLNEIAAEDSNKIAAEDSNKIAAEDSNKIAAEDSNKIAALDYNIIAARNYNKIAAEDSNKIAALDYNKIAAQDYCILATGQKNEINIGGKSLAVAGNNSKIQGHIGSFIVIYERDHEMNIISVKAGIIDGIILKENVFYCLKNGEFEEVKDGSL